MKPHAWFVLIVLFLITFGSSTAVMAQVDTLSAGTVLNVRTTQPISADRTGVGMRFTAVVDDPVVDASGRIVFPRGSSATLEAVNVERSSNLKGRDRITLKVRSVRVGSQTYPVATSTVELKGHSEGNRAARKTAGGAALGAAVGGLVGGGTGAVFGATAGGVTGAVVAGSGKTNLNVPAETRLYFRLDAPVRVRR